jgi:hypothetical protein
MLSGCNVGARLGVVSFCKLLDCIDDNEAEESDEDRETPSKINEEFLISANLAICLELFSIFSSRDGSNI